MTPAPQLPTLTYPCPFCAEPHEVVMRLGGTPGGGTPIVVCPQLGGSHHALALHIVLGPPMFLITGKQT